MMGHMVWFNTERTHRGLDGATPNQTRRKWLAEGWEPRTLDSALEALGMTLDELKLMALCQKEPVAHSDRVTVEGFDFTHPELRLHDRTKVRIHYDPDNMATVVVTDLQGEFICEAELDVAVPGDAPQEVTRAAIRRARRKVKDGNEALNRATDPFLDKYDKERALTTLLASAQPSNPDATLSSDGKTIPLPKKAKQRKAARKRPEKRQDGPRAHDEEAPMPMTAASIEEMLRRQRAARLRAMREKDEESWARIAGRPTDRATGA